MSNYNRIILRERVRIEAGIYAKKSFGEIAEELGISQAQVSRLEKSALKIIFEQKDKMKYQ